ncbi:hypothetical protein NECAME_15060, partial [Necator americanus]
IPDPHAEELFCLINGVEKQRCKTDVMIFDIPTLIEYTTRFVTLEEGDLLLTGTPAGVCKVLPAARSEEAWRRKKEIPRRHRKPPLRPNARISSVSSCAHDWNFWAILKGMVYMKG